jgi:hypothetical protein
VTAGQKTNTVYFRFAEPKETEILMYKNYQLELSGMDVTNFSSKTANIIFVILAGCHCAACTKCYREAVCLPMMAAVERKLNSSGAGKCVLVRILAYFDIRSKSLCAVSKIKLTSKFVVAMTEYFQKLAKHRIDKSCPAMAILNVPMVCLG